MVTGDIEDEEEERLLEAGVYLRADILKVPHHGGYAGPSGRLFEMTAPRISVISVGKDNKYGHPAEGTLEDLARTGGRIYRTDEGGDIIVEVGEGGFVVREEKSR
jgi:competence protein ComEC